MYFHPYKSSKIQILPSLRFNLLHINFSPSLSTRKPQTSVKDFSKRLREQTQPY